VFDPNAKVERTALYDVYTQYCESEGFKNVESRIACYNQVRALPQVIENKDEKGNRYFAGVQIKKN
jgi:hypothetical protein